MTSNTGKSRLRPNMDAPLRLTRTSAGFAVVLFVVWFALSSTATAQNLTVWANNGEDKVSQNELRASSNPQTVINSVWDGSRINLFGARNETVSFCLVLESQGQQTTGVSVQMSPLTGPNGALIRSQPTTGDGVFNWIDRPVEMFYVRYLQIKGVGRLVYQSYDERHIPERLRRPFSGEGIANSGTGWSDRPDHDRYYPDIAVPLEVETPFTIQRNQNQCIWVDVYIPRTTPAGNFTATISVVTDGNATIDVPVQLVVRDFSLPEQPSLGTMLYVGYADINRRYIDQNTPYPDTPADLEQSRKVLDRHFMMAHRHRISLIGAEGDAVDQPHPNWEPRLSGELFTPANGYAGTGTGVGNDIYSIGTYGSWGWKDEGEPGMHRHTNAWVNWFDQNASNSDYFLYLIDESTDYPPIERWSQWMRSNTGPGRRMPSFATLGLTSAVQNTPALRMPCAAAYRATASQVQQAADSILSDSAKILCYYNGSRPYTGTFATEDDGVALRTIAWSQFKKKVQRWFFWESTYYNNFQHGSGETNLFRTARTFGSFSSVDPVFGETGFNYSNGDGVLFYPGTDRIYPAENYQLGGPIASLRLKHWRRGLQDGDYLTLAYAKDPAAVDRIVERIMPKSIWEYGVTDPSDPSYVLSDVSWSTNPDVWETARAQLADIIDDDANSSPECGRPNIQRDRERDLFIWNDCATDQWHVSAAAGANASNGDRVISQFNGRVEASAPFSEVMDTDGTLEPNDQIIHSSGSNRIDFRFGMASGYNGIDTVDFNSPVNADVCLDMQSFGGQQRVLVGANKRVVSNFPVDLRTLDACRLNTPEISCGSPDIDRANDRGLFLWVECGTNQWHLSTVGGENDQNGNRIFSKLYGSLESESSLSDVTGVALEAGDDAFNSTAQQINFTLQTASGFQGIDTIDFKTPADSAFCIRLETRSQPLNIRVGSDRLLFANFPASLGARDICR